MLIPRKKVPPLIVQTLDHGLFDLAREKSGRGTLICIYRGYHCPICATYLKSMENHVAAFAERGVGTIAISGDGQDRARAMAGLVGPGKLRIGYGLALQSARDWGVFLSTSRGKTSVGVEEPAIFPEPGIFLVRPDGNLYWSMVQSMPFARPHFEDLLQALDNVIAKSYPARGQYWGDLPAKS
jgi:peroxiredoxin